jgi:hypothetical protein
MKRLLCLIAFAIIAVVIIAMPALAQRAGRAPANLSFASDFQTLAVVANTTGAGGAVFQTYVALLNPTSSSFAVTATLYDSAGVEHDATITLAAGELKTYQNFVDAVFHRTGGGAVTLSSPSSANRFVVNAEIWTDGGRYGTGIPALEFAGSDSRSFAPGITVGANSRTNVGCFNQSDAANHVTATVRDATGTLNLGTVTFDLPANAWSQTALSTVVSNGYVQFDPSDSAVCYAVVVDNSTNDGRYIAAAEFRP